MRRNLLLLREMRDAVEQIRDLAVGLTVDQVEADTIRRSALLWHFTVLGEAANQIPAEIREAHPEVAWRAATRLRNRIVHGYWSIEIETLLATAADDLPTMSAQLQTLIATLHDGDDPTGLDSQG